MSNTPARIPFSLLPVGAPTGNAPSASVSDVNRELQRIQRQQTGLFQPRVLVHGMGGDPSPYIVRGTDWLILADATDGAVSIVFPAAARLDGLRVTVVKTDASTHAVTLTGTFSGLTNPTLATRYRSQMIDAGNGVWYFSPTGNAADFQSGTWTPTISSGWTSPTYSTQAGSYQMAGNLLRFEFSLRPATGTARNASQIIISGLPRPAASNAGGLWGYANEFVTAGTTLPLLNIASGTSTISFFDTNGFAFVGTSATTDRPTMFISGVYPV